MQVNLIRNTLQSNQDGRPIVRPLRVEFLAVAGGGGATDGNAGGGGGGAGGLITGSFCAEKNTNYPIVIGDGGAPKTGGTGTPLTADNGQDTTLFGVTAIGGGAGSTPNYASGSAGGSGGGGGNVGGSALQPTATYVGFGNNGGIETDSSNTSGGGGGGAGSAGSDTPANAVGGNGGDGKSLTFFTSSALYAPGGAGAGGNGLGTPGTGLDYGRGGNAGNIVTAATSGSAGVVIIKYQGATKGTGGTILEHDGYTYHTFTSGSTNFVVTKNEDNFALNNCNDGTSV